MGAGKEAISSEQSTILALKVYSDADFVGEIDGMKSMSGFVIIDLYGASVYQGP